MFFLAWAAHYFPFFLMGRSLFLHHYLPSLIYSMLLTASLLDFAFKQARARKTVRLAIVTAVIFVCFVAFVWFIPTTYGFPLTREQVGQRKWFKSWDYQFAPNNNNNNNNNNKNVTLQA
jgi:dolichyl-phosphate-mannose-protein mannosyltransferase